MTTAEKLDTVHSACLDIKQAIIDKGQTPSGGISTYADAIESISAGGGGTTLLKGANIPLNFYIDFDYIMNNGSEIFIEDSSTLTAVFPIRAMQIDNFTGNFFLYPKALTTKNDGVLNSYYTINDFGSSKAVTPCTNAFSSGAVRSLFNNNESPVYINFGALDYPTDPDKSSLVAQLSNITTSLDGYYYIVIATSTKTDIQVDIDEIATDLNGKADVDLSNVPTSKGILTESYVNGTSWYRVYSDGWCEQGGTNTLTANGGQTIAFLKPFITTTYTIIGVQHGGDKTSNLCVTQKSTQNVTLNPNGAGDYDWQACGYIR